MGAPMLMGNLLTGATGLLTCVVVAAVAMTTNLFDTPTMIQRKTRLDRYTLAEYNSIQDHSYGFRVVDQYIDVFQKKPSVCSSRQVCEE